MAYTVQQLAKLSGVSVRTLHYYDEIELLKPAYHGANGYRYYEEEQLLRLQQILFFRELGFKLERIKGILGRSDFHQIAALASHRQILEQEVGRLGQLILTINKTIKHLKEDSEMEPIEMYLGFSKEKQKGYEKELIEAYGQKAQTLIAESKVKTKGWSADQWRRSKQQGEEVTQQLAKALEKGAEADSDEVQALVAQLHKWVSQFWTPDRESYIRLGQLYIDHPEMKAHYEGYHRGLAAFLAEAMKCYAERNLS